MNTQTSIRKGRKFDQVLEGARTVFMADGFEGASVDDIARAAGVSKATLYSYFPDKRLLFMEVATTECCRQSDQAPQDIDMSGPPQLVLDQVGRTFLRFITSKFGQQIFRLCVAEGDRFPDLAHAFYESGPMAMQRMIIEYFRQSIARGELRIDDLDLAASQFAELCKADLWTQLVFGIAQEHSNTDIDRVVTGAVDTFMARYGT
ncbi:TetR/AcrR family transcriptional regulator [Primorskyibacter flagellatus]|uniref:Transcriptional regulator, TetR family n=1 Tax=Primorskyibacter flagellatus TaxID=1387277 RepID=A0A1W1ZXK9_9RHOB|nr:TetR/AcrR family transcriptional regulator [Primorskyibacter flagellatus]SMC53219.1 transcriptional regulator, TetR family [Primorskyibacter flagellatus]